MKRFVFVLLVATLTLAAGAQTPAKPSTTTTAAPKTASAPSAAATAASTPAPWIKLPPGVPAVTHGLVKTSPIVVHYEDIKVGAGAEGAAGKLWHLKYTGWRVADGVKFDSWDEHVQPILDKDGKPELSADGKPKMGDPQPVKIPQGIGAVIPGFDFGLAGMKIGGQRRIFIPWQLAYGTRAIPDHPGHPGIPAKSDLIFDVELVDMSEMPASVPAPVRPPTTHPGAAAQPGVAPASHATPTAPATTTPAQAVTPVPSIKPATAAPATTTTPATTGTTASAPAQPK